MTAVSDPGTRSRRSERSSAAHDAATLLERSLTTPVVDRPLRQYVLALIASHDDIADRHGAGPGHLTVSAVVVDGHGRTLLTLHPKFGRWMQIGGHLEPGDATLSAAVLREVVEETGLTDVELDPVPLGVGVFDGIPCPPGQSRQHLDIRFLVRAASTGTTISEESLELEWWPLTALPEPCDDDLRLLASQARARLEAAR